MGDVVLDITSDSSLSDLELSDIEVVAEVKNGVESPIISNDESPENPRKKVKRISEPPKTSFVKPGEKAERETSLKNRSTSREANGECSLTRSAAASAKRIKRGRGRRPKKSRRSAGASENDSQSRSRVRTVKTISSYYRSPPSTSSRSSTVCYEPEESDSQDGDSESEDDTAKNVRRRSARISLTKNQESQPSTPTETLRSTSQSSKTPRGKPKLVIGEKQGSPERRNTSNSKTASLGPSSSKSQMTPKRRGAAASSTVSSTPRTSRSISALSKRSSRTVSSEKSSTLDSVKRITRQDSAFKRRLDAGSRSRTVTPRRTVQIKSVSTVERCLTRSAAKSNSTEKGEHGKEDIRSESSSEGDECSTDDGEFYEVEALVAYRKTTNGIYQFRVKWEGYDPSANTWENIGELWSVRKKIETLLKGTGKKLVVDLKNKKMDVVREYCDEGTPSKEGCRAQKTVTHAKVGQSNRTEDPKTDGNNSDPNCNKGPKEKPEISLRCPVPRCPYITRNGKIPKTHLENHSKVTEFSCSQCTYYASNKGWLLNHIRLHEHLKDSNDVSESSRTEAPEGDEDESKSEDCGKEGEKNSGCPCIFGGKHRKSGLKAHLKNHSEVTEFSCSHCTYFAKNKIWLKRHTSLHENLEKSEDESSHTKSPEEDEDGGQSEGCNKGQERKSEDFSRCPIAGCPWIVEKYRKGRLRAHVKSHSNVTEFSCSHCTYYAKTKSSLKKHTSLHKNLEESEDESSRAEAPEGDGDESGCEDTDKEREKIPEVSLRCPIAECPCIFVGQYGKNSLKAHLENHSTVTEFACTHCSYYAKNKAWLKRHTKLHENLEDSEEGIPVESGSDHEKLEPDDPAEDEVNDRKSTSEIDSDVNRKVVAVELLAADADLPNEAEKLSADGNDDVENEQILEALTPVPAEPELQETDQPVLPAYFEDETDVDVNNLAEVFEDEPESLGVLHAPSTSISSPGFDIPTANQDPCYLTAIANDLPSAEKNTDNVGPEETNFHPEAGVEEYQPNTNEVTDEIVGPEIPKLLISIKNLKAPDSSHLPFFEHSDVEDSDEDDEIDTYWLEEESDLDASVVSYHILSHKESGLKMILDEPAVSLVDWEFVVAFRRNDGQLSAAESATETLSFETCCKLCPLALRSYLVELEERVRIRRDELVEQKEQRIADRRAIAGVIELQVKICQSAKAHDLLRQIIIEELDMEDALPVKVFRKFENISLDDKQLAEIAKEIDSTEWELMTVGSEVTDVDNP